MSDHDLHRRPSVLLRPTLRVLPWGQLLGVGLAAILLGAFSTADDHLPVALAVDRLRLVLPLFAVAVASVLDDPTRPHLDTTPASLAARQGLRLTIALPIVAIWWVALLVLTNSRLSGSSTDDANLPVTSLTVVLGGLVALALATSAVMTRRRTSHAGLPAAGVALVVPTVLASFEPLRQRWFPPHPSAMPDSALDELWNVAHQRWAVLAVIATAVLLWSLRDPAQPVLPGRIGHPLDRRHPTRREPRHRLDPTSPTGGTPR